MSVEKEVLREMQRRIVKSLLDVLILAQLRKEAMSAYDVIAFIHEEFHILLSPGTVYATMYSLQRNRLIQGSWGKRKRGVRVYTLTNKGEKTVQAFQKGNDKIQLFIANLLGPSK